MTDAMADARTQRRQQLRANGYMPLPLFGKAPPLKEWQKLTVISRDMITLWGKVWPDASNTGCLTRLMPTLDLDILGQDAAVAVEEFVSQSFIERGPILVRIGKAPKRAILFRTNTPFRKITAPLIAPNGINDEKVELLGDGQQLVVDGVHPETRKPYAWFGGVPWDIAHAELPYLHEHEAHQLVEDVVRILADHGHACASPPRVITNGRGSADKSNGDERWHELIDNILLGRALHDSFRDLAAMLAASGMSPGPAKRLLQALGEQIEPYDARVEARLRDIERAMDSAYAKYSKQ
jgi:Bifunctional DNA primase/polymerase, N-terminal